MKPPDQNVTEIYSALPLETYAKQHGGAFSRILATIVPRFLKEKLLVSVPGSLALWPEGAAALFRIARALRTHGVFDEWREMPSLPDEPPLFAFESALKKSGLANGADPFDKNAALIRMLAESYERSRMRSADLTKRYSVMQDTPSGMAERGPVIPPSRFTGWTELQLTREPALAGRDDASYTWVKLPTLAGSETWVPLSAVSPLHEASLTEGPARREPLVRPLTSSGLATGRSVEEARMRGVLEVIERDAFMVAYLNRFPGQMLDATELARGNEQIEILLERVSRFDLTLRLLRMPSEFPIYSICAVIEDKTSEGPAIVVGGKASFSLTEAVRGAVSEALYDRRIYRIARLGTRTLPRNPRAFTTQDRIAYWGKREHARGLDFLFEKWLHPFPAVPAPVSDVEGLRILKDALSRGEYEVCFADLTDNIGKALGWHSVLTVIPGLHPMHLDEFLPYVGGERLTHAPVRFGYSAPEKLNPIPHPYP